jgi:drug/metabolite transporter (DMT)-like permease
VAVLIGIGFGEEIGWSQIGSMAVVLIGVFIANYWTQLKRKVTKNVDTL